MVLKETGFEETVTEFMTLVHGQPKHMEHSIELVLFQKINHTQ